MTEKEKDKGFSGIGPWLAVGSELPCSVIALLLVGQIPCWSNSRSCIWWSFWCYYGCNLGFYLRVFPWCIWSLQDDRLLGAN